MTKDSTTKDSMTVAEKLELIDLLEELVSPDTERDDAWEEKFCCETCIKQEVMDRFDALEAKLKIARDALEHIGTDCEDEDCRWCKKDWCAAEVANDALSQLSL